ncbi:MAG: type II secretion system protein M [Gammaproteobacteria bacterium]|nr:type II secretion system protein M [Gammaproteobacteria bacterium]
MKNIHDLMARFDVLSQRERSVIAILVLVIMCLLAFVLFIEPVMQESDKTKKQLFDLDAQVTSGQAQLAALEKALTLDPDAENYKKLSRLKDQQKTMDKKLQDKMQGLIEPAQMAHVLEVVLSKTSRLRLEKLKNLPTRPLINQAGEDTQSQLDIGVYQHGLQIELSGSYLSMLDYLKALKSLPWNFYWDRLDLQVDKYPRSTIVIEVHTLSFNEGWIGV